MLLVVVVVGGDDDDRNDQEKNWKKACKVRQRDRMLQIHIWIWSERRSAQFDMYGWDKEQAMGGANENR